jgi:hypothetical protein
MLYAIQTRMPYKYPDALYNKYRANRKGMTLTEFLDYCEDEAPDEILYVMSLEMDVFIGIISPFTQEYEIRVHHELKKSILHLESELPRVEAILTMKGINYKVSKVLTDGTLKLIKPYEKEISLVSSVN